MYSEYHKMLRKEIKDYTHRWKDILCSCIGTLNTVRKSILPANIQIPFNSIKLPMALAELNEELWKIKIYKTPKIPNRQSTPKKEKRT